MKKFFIILGVFALSIGTLYYFHNCLYYTFYPTEVLEVTKEKISHKELRERHMLPKANVGYNIVKSRIYLYEGFYFYRTKTLVDTLKDEYGTYDNGL